MPTVRGGFVRQSDLSKEVSKAIRKLGKDVVRVNYSVEEDWSGDEAIYFRIVLTDAASRQARLGEVTTHIRDVLREELHSLENWGLPSYFDFRSKSEQDKIKNDPQWA